MNVSANLKLTERSEKPVWGMRMEEGMRSVRTQLQGKNAGPWSPSIQLEAFPKNFWTRDPRLLGLDESLEAMLCPLSKDSKCLSLLPRKWSLRRPPLYQHGMLIIIQSKSWRIMRIKLIHIRVLEMCLPKPFSFSDSVPKLPSKHSAHSSTLFYKHLMVSLLRARAFIQGEWKVWNELWELYWNTSFSLLISKMGMSYVS